MTIKPAYYTGIQPGSFRVGKPALITGVVMLRDDNGEVLIPARPCYVVVYPDGQTDYCPVEDKTAYKITGYP